MKFRNQLKIELGMRFYIITSVEEYQLYSVVNIDKNERIVYLLNEETFEVEEVSLSDLDKDYTLLSDYEKEMYVKFQYTFRGQEIVDLYNARDNSRVIIDTLNLLPGTMVYSISMVTYNYMTKKVMNETIKHIFKYQYNDLDISDKELNTIWELYFNHLLNNLSNIFSYSDAKISFNKAADVDNRLPDRVFEEVEEVRHTIIVSYKVYHMDPSVNLDRIIRSYFIMYSVEEDEYFIILYSGNEDLYNDMTLSEYAYDENISSLISFMNDV